MGKERAESVVESIRRALREGGKNGKGKGIPEEMLFVPRDGVKVVRFLSDFEECVSVEQHDKYGEMYPQPCFKYYGKKCPFHGSRYRTAVFYAWTVYDYESETKRLAVWRPSTNSPIEDLLEIYEKNGTLKDRDIKIIRVGGEGKTRYKAREAQGQPTEYAVKNKKNPFASDKVFAILKGSITVVKAKEADLDTGGDGGGSEDDDD